MTHPIVGRSLYAAAITFIFGLVFGLACTDAPKSSEQVEPPSSEVGDVPKASFDIRAVTLDARDRPSDAVIDEIAALGATDITLIPFGFQETPHTPAIRRHTDGGWYSESTRGIRDLASRAAERELGIILKPHIWIGHYSADGQERDAIGFDTEADWAAWQAEYREFLLYYARLAADIDARALVIGCELTRAVRERPEFWRSLIAAIRSVYNGKLTYAANWNDDLREIEFWDALDYVGVQAYFPLVHDSTSGGSVTVEHLRAGWERHGTQLEEIHRATDRPLLFTELGYRSDPDAAKAPWRWPEEGESVEPDPMMQARCYQAFFQALGSADWLAGAIVWKWHPEPESKRPTGFTPQNKPAAAILRQGFGAAG